MTQIERREMRIKHIHTRTMGEKKKDADDEQVAVDVSVHHCIGKSENFSDHIGLFTAQRSGDPAFKVITRSPARSLAHCTARASFQN
jgi:hypothetical protein